MTLYQNIASNTRKTWGFLILFFFLITTLGYFISEIYGQPGFLYFAIAYALISNVVSYWYSDKIVLALNHARKINQGDFPEVFNLLENLCIASGLSMPALYVINDEAPNAFATGRDEKHASIAVTSGLISRLNRTELEGVLAHELSHVKNRDILLSTVIAVLVSVVTILADWSIRFSFMGRGDDRKREGNGALLIIGLIFIILSPIIATIIQLAISRKREFLADSSGALITRYPEGLIHALEKISDYPVGMKNPSTATAHLFFTSPFKSKDLKNFFVKIFSTHPPIHERIKALENML